ncbi:glutathione S-transferase II [Xylaria sp. FL1777]|nr:glutathione S-transferase II [Xylaria sp. FL1777]
MKPVLVWMAPPGPNPWKVVLVLEELGVPYEIKSIRFEHIKKKPFIDLNPNGRVPDPNTDLVLWESGAIINYLIEQYDKSHILSYDTIKEKHLCNQWLHFQMSGQGPYFGQAGWFTALHSEKLPSVIERYRNEVRRIHGVLDKWLQQDGGRQWLVGDKMTYADLAFTTWNERSDDILGCAPEDKFCGFPHLQAWHERMTQRPSWKSAMDSRTRLMDEQGLTWTGMPKDVHSLAEYEAKIKADEEAAAAAAAAAE